MTWIDWAVVVLVVVASIAAGTGVVRLSSRHGAVSYFTSDRNLQYQQNLKGRSIAILLLSTNHWPTLKKQVPLVQAALDKVRRGAFARVEIPAS